MRRYRNARYAPETLERKLSPSAGVVAAPAMVDCEASSSTGGADGTGPDTTIDYSPDAYTGDDTPPPKDDTGSAVADNDGDVPPPPGDTPPTDPPPTTPTGPLVPAYA